MQTEMHTAEPQPNFVVLVFLKLLWKRDTDQIMANRYKHRVNYYVLRSINLFLLF